MSATIWLTIVALAIAMGRAFIDWGFVYPEFGMTDPGPLRAPRPARTR